MARKKRKETFWWDKASDIERAYQMQKYGEITTATKDQEALCFIKSCPHKHRIKKGEDYYVAGNPKFKSHAECNKRFIREYEARQSDKEFKKNMHLRIPPTSAELQPPTKGSHLSMDDVLAQAFGGGNAAAVSKAPVSKSSAGVAKSASAEPAEKRGRGRPPGAKNLKNRTAEPQVENRTSHRTESKLIDKPAPIETPIARRSEPDTRPADKPVISADSEIERLKAALAESELKRQIAEAESRGFEKAMSMFLESKK